MGNRTRAEALKKGNYSGGKAKALKDVAKFIDHPDEPIVPAAGNTGMEPIRNLGDLTPAKIYQDGGHKVRVTRALANRAMVASPPRTREGVFTELGAFMEFCEESQVPPLLGFWALWNGVTLHRLNQIERNRDDRERAEAFATAKEALRSVMEACAWDNTLSPLILFHSHKALYGIAENVQVTVSVEDNTSEITEDEYQERITLLQGDDGVFRSE